MSNEIVLQKGKLLDTVYRYKEQKEMKGFLDMLEQLVDFREELVEMKTNIEATEKHVDALIDRFNKGKVSKEEARDNFVKFIKQYKTTEWKRVIETLK